MFFESSQGRSSIKSKLYTPKQEAIYRPLKPVASIESSITPSASSTIQFDALKLAESKECVLVLSDVHEDQGHLPANFNMPKNEQ